MYDKDCEIAFDRGYEAGIKDNGGYAQLCVRCPSQEDIDKAVDEYGFQVPYDGSNEFYDKDRMKHFRAGIEFVIKHIKRQ